VPAPGHLPPARDQDRLLFIGRLIERKGLAWFVRDVLPRIVTLRSSVRLAILGDGPERPKIISAAQGAGIADNLIWLGAANDDVKASELARAAICVMPNVAVDGDIEGFGIVALEAAAAGCPLVAADIDGLRDAVADGRSGTLVASRNADAWVYAIEQVLADAAASRQAGETARGYVSQHGSWDAIIEAYERLFLDIAGSVRQRAP
jgi:phosphatidylinositol alpha-1,6-mannosyltransferase